MSTKIGRFEILSELAKSNSGCVYKAADPESGQTVALKTIHLDAFGERAQHVVDRILQEAESTKDLTSINLTLVYGAGEIDGQICATMEYIQGNSIATMLTRKEGFSIWDLLDISRQVCQGLDHAHQHNVFHYNLEPAKVMVTWDGTVKILSLGISSKGLVDAGAEGVPPSTLYYMSPEQVRGEPIDARSNIFTWGAMLYEMVTDRKAFDGADAGQVRQQILEAMPTPPAKINPKINPVASEVIMKAIAKDPAERYQSGHELAADLEKCREATGKTAGKPAQAPKGPAIPDQAKAAAAAKFAAGPGAKANAPAPPKFEVKPEPQFSQPSSPQLEELDTAWSVPSPPPSKPAPPAAKATPDAAQKAAAAAAGRSSTGASKSTAPKADPTAQFISSVVKASIGSFENQNSAVLDDPSVEQPKIAVDPMMAEGGGAGKKGVSFSDLAELPPLKEIYVPPSPVKTESSETEAAIHPALLRRGEPEKPKIQPREVAEKALKEIKSVPPQLLLYSIAGALALILVIGLAVLWHSHSQSTDEEGGPVAETPAETPQPAAPAKRPAPQATAPEPVQSAPQAEAPAEPSEPEAEEPVVRKGSHAAAAAAPRGKGKKQQVSHATIPGQLVVNSIPDGAQVQIDGHSDPSWVTPYTASTLAPGEHVITVNKSGFVSDTRTVDITSANRSSVMVHLITLVATLTVNSNPAGASIFVDGKDTQQVTPSQISLEKGTHTILVRKSGFLDETVSENAQPGQSLRFAPSLRALGNVDDIKTVGKFKKLFGGNQNQGMAKVSIKTTPKGAQIAINRRLLEKGSPMEILLNPGNYIVDITLSGYKPVQRVITVEQNNNAVVEETLQPE
jgi:serine/threonine-protein kinase